MNDVLVKKYAGKKWMRKSIVGTFKNELMVKYYRKMKL